MKKYSINENFFEKIQTEEQAYWLGFIVADGSIYGNYLEIGLALKDYTHLKKFCKSIKTSTKRIKFRKNSCRIIIYSKKIISDLNKLGVARNKTFKVKPWIGPKHLLSHYWRGIFDGDGCLTYNKKRKQWASSLVGNKFIVKAFDFYLKQFKTFLSKAKIYKHASIWAVSYGGLNMCKSLCVILYKNSKLFLTRKKTLSKKILNTKGKIYKIKNINKNILIKLYNKLNNWSKVASKLCVSHNGLYKHVKKLNLKRRIYSC